MPASLRGVWGFRPSLYRISEAGVLPFMQSVSTVGIVADRFDFAGMASECLTLCARLRSAINTVLTPGTVLCFPTTLESGMDFYDRTMAITALSGVAGLPELSAPLMTVDGCPAGVSIAAGHDQDEALFDMAGTLLPPA